LVGQSICQLVGQAGAGQTQLLVGRLIIVSQTQISFKQFLANNSQKYPNTFIFTAKHKALDCTQQNSQCITFLKINFINPKLYQKHFTKTECPQCGNTL
jgi:Zn finger protein HypA/HybF involved in hydrogenase expression